MPVKMWLKPLVKIAISLVLLTWLVSKVDIESLKQALFVLDWRLMIALYVGYLLVQFFSSWRWAILAKGLGLADTLINAFRDYLVGMYYGLFVPTGIGGDVGRAWRVSKRLNQSYVKAILSTLAERFCGFAILMTIAIIGLTSYQPLYWQQLVSAFVLLFVMSWAVCFFMPKIQAIVHEGAQKLHVHLTKTDDTVENEQEAKAFSLKNWLLYSHHLDWPRPFCIVRGLMLSVVVHSLNTTLLWLLVSAIGQQSFPWWQMASVYAVMAAASMVPLSFSGIGLRENALATLLVLWFGLSLSTATAISLVWLLILLLAAFPGGIIQFVESLARVKPVTLTKTHL